LNHPDFRVSSTIYTAVVSSLITYTEPTLALFTALRMLVHQLGE
jgi:hypothetical protein